MSITSLLTIGTCATVVLIFVYRIITLYRVSSKIDINSKAYKSLYDKYQLSIGRIIKEKTLRRAEDFFTVENFYDGYGVNYRHIKATASTLVGLGIFGTFLGLAISLGQIDLSGKEDEITKSIQSIMGGINTAFYSSVFGMSLSLVFALCHRTHINKLQKDINTWCEQLDEQYLADQITLIAEQTNAINNFGQAIGSNVGNQVAKQLENSLTELIETITDCIKDEMKAAGTFMADSASQLKESSETLLGAANGIKKSTEGMQTMLKEVDKSMAVISKTISNIEKVQESFDNSASELGDSSIQLQTCISTTKETIVELDNRFGLFNEAMSKVETSFKSMQSTYLNALSHNSKLDEQYKNVHELIGKIDSEIEKQNKQFYISLESLKKTIEEVPNLKPDIEAIFEKINEGLRSYVDLLQNQTSGLLNAYTSEFTKACQSIQSTTGQLSSVMEEGTSNLTEAIKSATKPIHAKKDKE